MKRELQSQWKNKQQNGYKYVCINNYFKCQWTKCSNQKTQGADWIKKKKTPNKTQDPSISCLQWTHRLKVREQEKKFNANGNKKEGQQYSYQKKNRLSNKNCNKRQRSTLYNDKGTNTRRWSLINIRAPNTGAATWTKQILGDIKGEFDNNTITVAGFNTPLTSMDRSFRQKISKATVILSDVIDQLDLKSTGPYIPK